MCRSGQGGAQAAQTLCVKHAQADEGSCLRPSPQVGALAQVDISYHVSSCSGMSFHVQVCHAQVCHDCHHAQVCHLTQVNHHAQICNHAQV